MNDEASNLSEDTPDSFEHPKSRPFDVNRWSDYPELSDCLTNLIAELQATKVSFRKASGKSNKQFRNAVRSLVLDLYVAWLDDPHSVIGISLSKGKYSGKSRYRALFLNWTSFYEAYNALKEHCFLDVYKRGYFDRGTGQGMVTRIRANYKLITFLENKARLNIARISHRSEDTEVVILRGPKSKSGRPGPQIEYEDTDETIRMRDSIRQINRYFSDQLIDVFITNDEYAALQRRMRQDAENGSRETGYLDLTQKHLVRIFNNSDWQQGGRFYGGWWQSIPKEYRTKITINTKQTIELDFTSLHPTLMYAANKLRCEGDAYDIDCPRVPRTVVKRAFNAMINASKPPRRFDNYSEYETGLSWTDLLSRIMDRHHLIKQYFHTGYGLRLQRVDSDIALEVMLEFIRRGQTCLPIHDSFIVHHANQNLLKDVMQQVFERVTGIHTDVKPLLETDDHYIPDTGKNVISTIPDSSWFEPTGPYSEYERRIRDWYLAREP